MPIRIFTFLFLFLSCSVFGQMYMASDTLYGNEWIDYTKPHIKIKVAEDALWRISQQTLADAGWPINNVNANQIRLFRQGTQVPVYLTFTNTMGPSDYIEFYGKKNRGELDEFLFDPGKDGRLTPEFSLFNDTAAYFLTWSDTGTPARITQINNDLSNPPAAEVWAWARVNDVVTTNHSKARQSQYVQYSWFDYEGWGGPRTKNTARTLTLTGLYEQGPSADISLRYFTDYDYHDIEVRLQDTLVDKKQIQGASIQIIKATVGLQHFIAEKANFKVDAVGSATDVSAVGSISVRYPHNLDANNATWMELETQASGQRQYVEVTNFNTSGGEVLVYDLSRNERLSATTSSNTVKFLLPAANAAHRIILINTSLMLKPVSTVQSVQFINYLEQPATYLFIANDKLRTTPAGNDPIADYASYRQSAVGGSHTTLIADIDQLYDQYAYGIDFHPFSIRNFAHRYKKAHQQAEYLLLAGKPLDYTIFRTSTQQSTYKDTLFFIPGFGTPACDQMFVMSNGNSRPIMHIGRLAASKGTELDGYLAKVKEYESLYTTPQTPADRAWMKRVLHLNGGGQNDTPLIRGYLSNFGSILEKNKFGAEVFSFEKKSDDPVLLSGFDQVQNLFRDGISLMTFMGHSSPTILSFDLGDPRQYPNSGKYPLFAVMGCYSGRCNTLAKGIGEEFVLLPKKGSIGYFASVNFGITSSLGVFGNEWYHQIGGPSYGSSVGESMSNTIDVLKSQSSSDLIALLHQFLYQGDPAIKVYTSPGPDYLVDNQTVSFNPNPIPVEEPTYKLDFDVINIGANVDSTIAVRIMQQMPGDTARAILLDTIPAPAYRTKLSYEFPSPGDKAVGFNRFFIDVDNHNQVPELPAVAETNNSLVDGNGQTGAEVFFFTNDIKPIWPPEYSIVNKDSITLQSSTLSSNSPLQEYLIEFDTTAKFNSPLKQSAVLGSKAGLISWKPTGSLLDSTVYFWRIARDTLIGNTVAWRNSSFTCIKGSPNGWDQSHPSQLSQNTFETMQINDSLRRVEFADNVGYFFLDVGYRGTGTVYTGFQNHLDQNFTGDYGWNIRNTHRGFILAVVDPVTGKYVPNYPGNPTNPTTAEQVYRVYDTRDSSIRYALMNYLKDSIPDGYFVNVFLMTYINAAGGGYDPEKWAIDSTTQGTNLFQILEAQGAMRIRELETLGNLPYGLIYRKNVPTDPVKEVIVTSTVTAEQLRKDFLAKWNRGNMISKLIGPAKSWKSAHWLNGQTDHPKDQYDLQIFKVREGQADELFATLPIGTPEIDLSSIGPDVKFLRLKYSALDTVKNTCTDMPSWRVLYDGYPEGAIIPAEHLTFYKDTLQQGEQMKISLAFRNISDYPMDSLLVRIRTEDNTGNATVIQQRQKPLIVGDSIIASASFDTKNMSGVQRLVVEFNPSSDQPELYHFNNIYVKPYFVVGDRIAPALDITFDGRRILNGDIVSPKPEIVIALNDDNKLLPISDTTAFSLFLTYPDGIERQIYFSDPNILFIPADIASGKNRAQVEFRPTLLDDGTYTLRVNGRDAVGNSTSSLDYKVEFQIINKSSLSNILNYPNPFSTSTCFFYTLTGLETPDQIMIRIMTISGRVVREVTTSEFGEMKTGTHLSNFCWDGKDEYGDQLANGVYYYQVFAKKANGESFDLFENQQADGYFKNGIGKMVLMR